jgi:hypothetical protein
MGKARAKVKRVNKNLVESLIEGIGGTSSSSNTDKSPINLDNWSEYLGIAKGKSKRTGELQEGQELNLKEFQEEKEEKLNLEPGIDYAREIIHVQETAINRENKELEAQLREIMAEIKKLTDSSKELQMQFKTVAVEEYVVTPGEYHKSFFSWLLSIVRAARMKVEDSGAWLQAMHSKKKSREYGAMSKKHGTSFTLNNERTVATQVG